MTRRAFAYKIAQDYAAFVLDCERHHGGATPAPLDAEYVFTAGRRIIERGDYTPRGDWRYMERRHLLVQAKRDLPAAMGFMRQVHDDWPHDCRVCGGTVRYQAAAA